MSDESKGAVSPERIWLQVGDGTETPDWSEVTWCRDRIDDTDTEYVRADLLAAMEARVAEAEAWKDAVIDAAVTHESPCHMRDARKTLDAVLDAAVAGLQAEIDRINDAQAASLGAEICRLTAANAAQAREIERLREALENIRKMRWWAGIWRADEDKTLSHERMHKCYDIADAALAPAADASGEVTP